MNDTADRLNARLDALERMYDYPKPDESCQRASDELQKRLIEFGPNVTELYVPFVVYKPILDYCERVKSYMYRTGRYSHMEIMSKYEIIFFGYIDQIKIKLGYGWMAKYKQPKETENSGTHN